MRSTVPTIRTRNWSSPFNVMDELRREVDRYFGGEGNNEWTVGTWLPTDVRETESELQFMVEAPGLSIDDIDITVEQNVLTISGEKQYEHEDEEGDNFRIAERRYGRFQRSFTLPRTVDADKIKARYENGVLFLNIPKAAEAKPRRIAIEGAGQSKDLETGQEVG